LQSATTQALQLPALLRVSQILGSLRQYYLDQVQRVSLCPRTGISAFARLFKCESGQHPKTIPNLSPLLSPVKLPTHILAPKVQFRKASHEPNQQSIWHSCFSEVG